MMPEAGSPGAAGPVGAVDCGTNSTRLLICAADGMTLERRMVITRLGDGVDRSRRLSEPSIGRTLAVLADYGAVMDERGVGARRAVATSAARDASNRDELFDPASALLRVRPELLSGIEEGRLSFSGATAGLEAGTGPVLVLDIGGGSTELVVGSPGPPDQDPSAPVPPDLGTLSLDVGCVRISERFLVSDPPTGGELAAARRHLGAELDRAEKELDPKVSACRLIGLAGTVSTAAMIDAGAGTYRREDVHHRVLHRARVATLLESLSRMGHEERAAVRGLELGRVDVIVGGLLVLAMVMERFDFEECLVSEADILDGMAADLLRGGAAARNGS